MEAKQDFGALRELMVDRQIRPNDIVEPRLVAALRAVAREDFVPPALAGRAYYDADVMLGGGRAVLAPLSIGRLLRAIAPRPGMRVLVIAAGTGYGAALLAQCGCVVTALETDADLRAMAERALALHAPMVRLVGGAMLAGDMAGAPYDAILIEGMVGMLPDALSAQLSPEGQLVTILQVRDLGRVIIAKPLAGGGFVHRVVADCGAPILPEFFPKAEFVF